MLAALPDVDLEIIGPAVIDPSEPIFGDKVTITLYLYNYGLLLSPDPDQV